MLNGVCKMPVILAYIMLAYVSGSIYYVCKTKNIGTPFNDSLTTIQKVIKEKSSKIRRNIFKEGLIISIIVILILKPFKSCGN